MSRVLALATTDGAPRQVLAYADADGRVISAVNLQPQKQSLYVSRPVLNAEQIRAWARAQGFTTALPPEDMHVTICYSREPVEWSLFSSNDGLNGNNMTLDIPSSEDRQVMLLGSDGALVLRFESQFLRGRHQYFRDHGASWDYDEYHPHITITYDVPPELDLSMVTPYVGPIQLGPEKFTPVEEGWAEDIEEYAEGEEGVWRTIGGHPVFIKGGKEFLSDTDAKSAAAGTVVAHPNGEPMKMFHGSVSEFENFEFGRKVNDPDAPFTGVWFTSDEGEASPAFTNPKHTYEAYLRVVNPAPVGVWWDVGRTAESGDAARKELLRRGYDGIIWADRPNINAAELARAGRVEFVTPRGVTYELRKGEPGIGGVDLYRRGEFITGYTDVGEFLSQNAKVVVALSNDAIKVVRRRPSQWGTGKAERSFGQTATVADYTQVKRDLDALEAHARRNFTHVLIDARDALAARVRRAKDLSTLTRDLAFPRQRLLREFARDLLHAAWADGGKDAWREVREAKKSVKEYADPASVRPREALKWLREKADFFVSGITGKLVFDIKNVLLNSIKTGMSIEEVITRLGEVFVPYLGDPGVIQDEKQMTPYRLETIIRTNVTEAYNHGRLAQFLDPDLIPFLKGVRYNAIMDERTTEVCRFLDGKVFKPSDPDLESLLPPNHHSCRSIISPVVMGETIDVSEFITPAEKGEAKGLADAKFLSQRGVFERYAEWDESKHPRHPEGSEQGGEFAPTTESGGMLTSRDLRKAESILHSHGWYPNGLEMLATQVQRDVHGRVVRVRMKDLHTEQYGAWYEKKLEQRDFAGTENEEEDTTISDTQWTVAMRTYAESEGCTWRTIGGHPVCIKGEDAVPAYVGVHANVISAIQKEGITQPTFLTTSFESARAKATYMATTRGGRAMIAEISVPLAEAQALRPGIMAGSNFSFTREAGVPAAWITNIAEVARVAPFAVTEAHVKCYAPLTIGDVEQYRYDPNQPRAPKGSGEGGQWTSASDASAEAAQKELKTLGKGRAIDTRLVFDHAPLSRDVGDRLDELMDAAHRSDRSIERVKISDLHPVEKSVVRRGVQQMIDSRRDVAGADRSDPVKVVRVGKSLVLLDGHHRVVAARLLGSKTISARVTPLDAERLSNEGIKL